MSERGRVVALALVGLALAGLLGLAGYLVARETIALPTSSLSADEPLAPPAPQRTTAAGTGRRPTTGAAASTTARTATTATTARTSTTERTRTGTTGDDDSGRGRGRGGDDDRSGSDSGSDDSGRGRGRGRSDDD